MRLQGGAEIPGRPYEISFIRHLTLRRIRAPMKDAAGIKAAIRQRGNMTSREQRRSGDWYSGRSVLCEGEVVVGLGWCRRCRLGAFQLVACRNIRDRTTTPTAKLILGHGTRLLIGLQPIPPDVEVRVQSSKVWWSHNDLDLGR